MSKTSTAAAAHRAFKRKVNEFVTPQGMPKNPREIDESIRKNMKGNVIDEVLNLVASTGNRPSLNWVAKLLKGWRRQMTVEQQQRVYRTLSGSRIQRAEAFA